MDKKDKGKRIKQREDSPKEKEYRETFSEEEHRVMNKAKIAVYILVLFLFIGIISVTYVFEYKFGKTAGTIAMAVVAVFLALYLYKDEIRKKIRSGKGRQKQRDSKHD